MKWIFLLLPVFSFAQSKYAVSNVAYANRDSMKAHIGVHNSQYWMAGLIAMTDQNGGTYMFDSLSSATANDYTIIQPTGLSTGRYLKQQNTNTLKDSASFNVITIGGTFFDITFSQTLPMPPSMVEVQAYSQLAALPCWVTNVTSTGFRVNFSALLATGTFKFKYLVIKY